MRAGVPFSIALHAVLFVGGVVVAPKLMPEPTPMMILPVDLLTIADATNVKPVAEPQPKKADPVEDVAAKAAPTPPAPPAPPPPPTPAEIIPTETAKKPEPPKKEEPKPAPEPPKPKEAMSDTLDSILKSVDKKTAKASADHTAANLRTVADAARQGAGDNQRMTVTIADSIRSQLQSRGCWGDKKDMPDAKRLRAVLRVRFERGGRLMGAPQLIDPARQPAADRPMLVFIEDAFSALRKCEPFQVPPQYYDTSQFIDLTFLP